MRNIWRAGSNRVRAYLVIIGAAMLGTSVPAAAEPRTHRVVLAKMKFGAFPQDARKGDTIIWVNQDMFRHTATARGAFDVDLPPGQVRKMRLTGAGDYQVICKYHPGMKSRLKVAK